MSKTTYIETEFGLLPSDWNLDELEGLFKTFSSASYSRGDMVATNGIACVHYGDIHTKFGYIVDLEQEELPLVTNEQGRRYKLLKDGDVLLADASEDDEGIGKSIAIICHGKPAIAGLHTIPLRAKKQNKFDTKYPSYLFAGRLVKHQVEKLSEGTKVNSITYTKIKDVLLPLPPTKAEQTAIAEALSDIDSLIRNFDRTIAKKQNIRQGAMEQLLSGQKRLPGFNKKWKESELDSIIRIKKGAQLNSSELLENGPYPMINGGQEPSGYTTTYNTESNTITISEGGNSCGFVNYIRHKFWSGGHCYNVSIRYENQVDKEFLFHLLKAHEKEIMSLRVGSGLPNIQSKSLLEMRVMYPTDLKEQQAIADTLTAMDDEIAMLQLERDKYANIRAGMMDELLSGKKRLI